MPTTTEAGQSSPGIFELLLTWARQLAVQGRAPGLEEQILVLQRVLQECLRSRARFRELTGLATEAEILLQDFPEVWSQEAAIDSKLRLWHSLVSRDASIDMLLGFQTRLYRLMSILAATQVATDSRIGPLLPRLLGDTEPAVSEEIELVIRVFGQAEDEIAGLIPDPPRVGTRFASAKIEEIRSDQDIYLIAPPADALPDKEVFKEWLHLTSRANRLRADLRTDRFASVRGFRQEVLSRATRLLSLVDPHDIDMIASKEYLEALHKALESRDAYGLVGAISGVLPLDTWSPEAKNEDTIQAARTWSLRLRYVGQFEPDAAKLAKAISAIADALEAIPGVKVTLHDWGRGSFWADLKISIENLAARREVEKVLSAARDGLMAKATGQTVTDTEKARAEGEKLGAEAEKIRTEQRLLHAGPDAEVKKQLELEMLILKNREKRIEIERKELDNQLLRLTIAKQAGELIKQGIATADPLEVEINGLRYVKTVGGVVAAGHSMVSIATAESLPSVSPDEDVSSENKP